MNKKLFLGMFAAAGMLFATSCSNDELDMVQSGNEAQVTFSLGLEGGIATRAISDGTSAKKLICAVYDANDANNKVLLDKVVINDEQVDNNGQYVNPSAFQGGLKDNVRITLAKGQTYTMVFWAQNEACKAYTTTDLKAVKVSYKAENGTDNASNNDEARDAFYAAETFKVEGNKEINVTLKRPFAQINVGVTAEDWEAAVASGITIKESSVVIKNVADEINLLTGAVKASEAMEDGITYALNAIPNDPAILKADADKDGIDEEYQWLSMSYILVNDINTDVDDNGLLGTDQAVLEGLQFTFKPENGESIEFKEGLAGAPVRRNWRTNILGKLLTGDVQFNITIDPAYNDDYIYPNGSEIEQELEFAAIFGGTVTLNGPVTLSKTLNVNADMIINLNGQTISGEFVKDGGAMINNAATLKLVGGTIKNTTANGDAVIRNSGNIILDGVTIEGAPIADDSYPAYAVYTSGSLVVEKGTKISSDRGAINMQDGANVTINGGDIFVTDALGTRVLTAHVIYAYGSNSKLTINDGSFALNYNAPGNAGASVICPSGATIDVYGGNFSYAGSTGQSGIFQNYMGYAAPVKVYGGTYNDKTFEKNLAAGYAGVDNGDGTWSVAQKVTSANIVEILNNLSTTEPTTLVISENISSDKTMTIPAGAEVTLVLTEKELIGTMHKNDGAVLKNEGTLKVVGGTIKSTAANGGSAVANYGTITIENATLEGAQREGNSWPSYPVNNYGNMTLKNSSIKGYQGAIACNSAGTTVVEDCNISKEYMNTSSHTFYITHEEANVVVNGGTYTNNGMDGSLAYVSKGTFTVNDGTFTASGGGYGIAALTNGKVIINGGTINNKFENWGGQISVTGGTFKADPTKYVEAGKTATKNTDGTWIVQ